MNEPSSLKNNKPNVGSTSFDVTSSESSDEHELHSISTGVTSKRPRIFSAVKTIPNSQLPNHVEQRSPLAKPKAKQLKQYSREELEQIIMGHMAGCFSMYKPYADVKQELDSCKNKFKKIQEENNKLTKEVAVLTKIVKKFVTNNETTFVRPVKQMRSIGLQVNLSTTDGVKHEKKNENFQAHSMKYRESKSSKNEFILTSDSQSTQNVDEYDSTSSSSCVSIRKEEFKGKDMSQQATESLKTKDEDELMVMLDKSTNFTQSNAPYNEHQPTPLLDPPKPVIKITKTTDDNQSVLRIRWKLPEKSNHALIASSRVFMLSENKNRFAKNDWIPITGEIPRMSKTFPLGNAKKSQNRYHFKVRVTDIHGRVGPYSDVVKVDFP